MIEPPSPNPTPPPRRRTAKPAKTMLILTPGCDRESLLALGRCLAVYSPVVMVGVVPIGEGENLSTGAAAAGELRRLFREHSDRVSLRARARIRVSSEPWDEVWEALADEPAVNLLVLDWPAQLDELGIVPAELLAHPPCDIALLRGPIPQHLRRILVPNLADPHAERALRLSLALAHRDGADQLALIPLEISGPIKGGGAFFGTDGGQVAGLGIEREVQGFVVQRRGAELLALCRKKRDDGAQNGPEHAGGPPRSSCHGRTPCAVTTEPEGNGSHRLFSPPLGVNQSASMDNGRAAMQNIGQRLA